MVALATLCILLGWSLVLLSTERQREQWRLIALRARSTALRWGGYALLAAGLACHVARSGVSQGIVYWTVSLMLAALAVTLGSALLAPGGSR